MDIQEIQKRVDDGYYNCTPDRMLQDIKDLLLKNLRYKMALEAIESGMNLTDKAHDMGVDTSGHSYPIVTMMAIARKAIE